MVFSSSYGNWPNTIYHLSPQTSSHFQNHQIFKSFSFFFPPFRWCKEDGAMLFSVVLSARVIGNEHQPEHKSFRLNIKKDFFTEHGTEHRHSPSTAVTDSTLPSWRFSEAVWPWSQTTCSGWPCLSRGLDQMASGVTLQPQPFCNSVIPLLLPLLPPFCVSSTDKSFNPTQASRSLSIPVVLVPRRAAITSKDRGSPDSSRRSNTPSSQAVNITWE